MKRRLVPVVAAVLGVAIGAAILLARPGAQGFAPVEVAAPSEIVAFQARMMRSDPHETFEGQFYRGADGSTREEGVVTFNDGARAAERVVGIYNASHRHLYVYRDSRGWMSTEILDDKKSTAPRYRLAQPGLDGLVKEQQRFQGLDVYRFSRDGGQQRLLAPALNFFVVKFEQPSTGYRREYADFRLGEQSADLFVPPPGVVPKPTKPYQRQRTPIAPFKDEK